MSKRKKKLRTKPLSHAAPSAVGDQHFSFGPNDGLTNEEENARTNVIMHLINYGGGLSDMTLDRMLVMEEVVKLLLEDVKRKDDIIALIKDRGKLTASDIRDGLAALDQHHAALSHGSL